MTWASGGEKEKRRHGGHQAASLLPNKTAWAWLAACCHGGGRRAKKAAKSDLASQLCPRMRKILEACLLFSVPTGNSGGDGGEDWRQRRGRLNSEGLMRVGEGREEGGRGIPRRYPRLKQTFSEGGGRGMWHAEAHDRNLLIPGRTILDLKKSGYGVLVKVTFNCPEGEDTRQGLVMAGSWRRRGVSTAPSVVASGRGWPP